MLCFAEKQCFMITNIYAVMLIAYIQALRMSRPTLKQLHGASTLCISDSVIPHFQTNLGSRKRELSIPMVPLHKSERRS